jgi:hypothetical protein
MADQKLIFIEKANFLVAIWLSAPRGQASGTGQDIDALKLAA